MGLGRSWVFKAAGSASLSGVEGVLSKPGALVETAPPHSGLNISLWRRGVKALC